MNDTVDAYVDAVLGRIPSCLSARTRIEADLRSHLADRIEGGESESEAVSRMGPPEEVAREFLRQIRLEPAHPARRTAAFVVDIALGLALVAPWILWFAAVAAGSPDGITEIAIGITFLVLLLIGGVVLALSILYFPVLEALTGRTPGKWLFGICVVRDTGERVGWIPAFVRRIPFYFEFFWLDAIFALFTKRRQRAFDIVAGTLVVRSDRRA